MVRVLVLLPISNSLLPTITQALRDAAAAAAAATTAKGAGAVRGPATTHGALPLRPPADPAVTTALRCSRPRRDMRNRK